MKRFWLLLILPVLVLIWWGLDRGGSAPLIHFSSVRRARIESTVSTDGKVEPAQWAAARAETAGVIRSVLVQRGQDVRAGQALISLDTTAAQAELAAALAREQQAQAEDTTLNQGGKAAQLASINDSIRSAKEAVAVAQRNYDALARLETQQAATKVQVQEAKDALTRAKLQLAAFQNQKQTLVTPTERTVAQANLHDARAAVAVAQRRLALAEVKAPISGTIYQFSEGTDQSDLKVGAYLHPGDLVALIGNLDEVKVNVFVDEPDLGRVGLNMPVKITWDARPGQIWWGRVDKLPTQVVALQTRTVGKVSTIVSNPNHDLLPGVTVNATIVSKVEENALSIPKAALRTNRGVTGVFKLEGDSITWTAVKTGISDINNVQILSGLKIGDHVADRVIQPSDAEVKNGMQVRAVFD